jgi:hypothetical protein
MYGFTDLEDRLLGTEGPAALAKALDSVRAIAAELRASMAGGLPKTDFAQAEKILAASAAAELILLNAAKKKGA